jgi:hypothetical protein
MPAFSNWGTGRYVGSGSEGDVLWIPKGYAGGGTVRGVVYVHGAGELALTPLNGATGKQNEAQLLARIASVYPMVMFDAGIWAQGGTTDSDNWGNTNAQTRLGQAITWLQTAPGSGGWNNPAGGGAKSGKVLLVGISMGHALSLTYAQANSGNVQAVVGILPVNDLDDIRDNNRGAYRASISTAWGTGTWTAPGTPALPTAANPAKTGNQTNLIAIPQKLWYANDDVICTPATCTSLISNIGANCTGVNMGNTGGHSDASVGAAPIADVLAFLAAHA